MVKNYQGSGFYKLHNLAFWDRDLFFVLGGEDKVHADHVIDEVGETKDEIVVQDVEPACENISNISLAAGHDDAKTSWTSEHSECWAGHLIGYIMDGVTSEIVLGTDELAGTSTTEQELDDETDEREEYKTGQKLSHACQKARLVDCRVKHGGKTNPWTG